MAAPRREGAPPAEAAGDPRPAAEGPGLLIPRDLPAHRLDVHQGQPMPDRGAAGARPPTRGDRERQRVLQAGAIPGGGCTTEGIAPSGVPQRLRAALTTRRIAPVTQPGWA